MARPYRVSLTANQHAELQQVRDHHPKPYIREQAAAILKIAAGQSIRQVARQGLLRPRRQETVKDWLTRYLTDGLSGLRVKTGRGRKPAFSPSVSDA